MFDDLLVLRSGVLLNVINDNLMLSLIHRVFEFLDSGSGAVKFALLNSDLITNTMGLEGRSRGIRF
jgi:hypothetical protein